MISGDTYGILHRLLLNQPIEPSPEGLFRLLGFVHVYSASGLHLLALESFLQALFGRSLAAKKILTVCFWFFLLLIWKLQGFRLGFARVLVLFFLRAMARVKGFRWRVYYPLFFAFCFDFACGIDSGWQHYYLAILGGMLGLELARERGSFMKHVYLSIASWLMTAPLDLWHQNTISWMTPIWSLITIPVIATFLYPASVFSYLVLDRIPEWLMGIWNHGADFLLKWVDCGFTFSVANPACAWLALSASVLAAIIFQTIKCAKNRLFFVVFSIIFVFFVSLPLSTYVAPSNRLVQLDVGQGDSLLVQRSSESNISPIFLASAFQHADRVEMIDLGTSRDVRPEAVLLRLARFGVTHVDTVLFSHLDEDHAGGVRLLLPWVPVNSLEVSSHFERTARLQNWLVDFPSTHWCARGCFQLGKVDWISTRQNRHFLLHAPSGLSTGNDLMGTVIIPVSSHEVYLALGDSDSKQESIFWLQHRDEILQFPIRYLKVSHHGSKNSSSSELLDSISPRIAIISAGRRNHYHHPHASVVNELMHLQIPIHRTDRQGDFILQGRVD